MNHKSLSFVSALAVLSMLAGCGPLMYGIGTKQAATPPQLVDDPNMPNGVMWNDVTLFGPVPANKVAQGEAVCATLNSEGTTYKAVGYHANARGYDGAPLPNGGFYCARR